MPLVRIDFPATTPPAERAALSQAVHGALVDVFRIPPDDRFHVLSPRQPGELVCTPSYLGLAHSDRVVFVQVTCSPGRTVGMKEQLYARIAADIERTTSFAAADVVINLLESVRENWSFGAGIAQYAVQDRERPAAAS